jgi:hypothetical protein
MFPSFQGNVRKTTWDLKSILQESLKKGFQQGDIAFVKMIQILEPNDEYFVLQMHHCVNDGWSVGLYMNDFENAYRGQLNTTSIEFQRFVEFVEHQDPDKMKSFWLEYLDGVDLVQCFHNYKHMLEQEER